MYWQYVYEEEWLVFLFSQDGFEKIFDLLITINDKETSLCFI